MNVSIDIVPGSVQSVAQSTGKSLAESFMACDVVVIIDTSGSMAMKDSRCGLSRYDAACEDLASIQGRMPGRVAVIAFSDDVKFCPGGLPVFMGNGTDLAAALQFAKSMDFPGMTIILISDGEPDNPMGALTVARTFTNKIDTIYVGPEGRSGAEYLRQLAEMSGGRAVTATCAAQLGTSISGLLGPSL